MISYILFDLDGTLINSEEGIINCAVYALKEMGIPVPEYSELLKFIGPPLSTTFMKEYGLTYEQSLEGIQIFRRRYIPKGVYECKLYDGIEDCLKVLKEAGYRLAVTSSKHEHSCHAILENLKIAPYFDEVVGSDDTGSRETKRQVLDEFFLRHPDVRPEETILVGDTHFDVEGAKGLMPCLGVTYGFGSKEELMESGALAVVNHPAEVAEYFLNGGI